MSDRENRLREISNRSSPLLLNLVHEKPSFFARLLAYIFDMRDRKSVETSWDILPAGNYSKPSVGHLVYFLELTLTATSTHTVAKARERNVSVQKKSIATSPRFSKMYEGDSHPSEKKKKRSRSLMRNFRCFAFGNKREAREADEGIACRMCVALLSKAARITFQGELEHYVNVQGRLGLKDIENVEVFL